MSRLRQEHGFTLPELLVVLLISGIALAGIAQGFQIVIGQSAGVIQKTDATQRGRLTMDHITQSVRSQVCVDVGAASQKTSLAAATRTSVMFYVDLSNRTKPPARREIYYEPGTKRIMQRTWEPTSAVGVVPTTWSNTAQTRVLLENVQPYTNGTPIFRYYGYALTGNPRMEDVQFDPGVGALTTTQLADTSRITIAYGVLPGKSAKAVNFTEIEDSVHLRTSDPNKNNPDPECRA